MRPPCRPAVRSDWAVVRHHRRWPIWVAVGAAAPTLWSYPTCWAIVGLALAVPISLAVIEFLDARPGDTGSRCAGPTPS